MRTQGHRPSRRALFRVAALGVLATVAGAASAESLMTRAPVDYSIFGAGEVQRQERRFDTWQLSCDEIRRLGQKFCSLRGVARASDGTIIAAVTLSTTDKGKPAALVRLPFGTDLATGLALREPARKGSRKPGDLRLQPSLCDRDGCHVLWPIAADDIRKLSANEPIGIGFRMAAATRAPGPVSLPMVPVEGAIQTAGFAAALKASMER